MVKFMGKLNYTITNTKLANLYIIGRKTTNIMHNLTNIRKRNDYNNILHMCRHSAFH